MAGTKRFTGSKSHLLPASMADSHPCRVGDLDAAMLQYSEILRRVHEKIVRTSDLKVNHLQRSHQHLNICSALRRSQHSWSEACHRKIEPVIQNPPRFRHVKHSMCRTWIDFVLQKKTGSFITLTNHCNLMANNKDSEAYHPPMLRSRSPVSRHQARDSNSANSSSKRTSTARCSGA